MTEIRAEIHGVPNDPPRRARDLSDAWKQRLLYEKHKDGSRLVAHVANAIVILRYCPAWAGRVRFDEFATCVTVRQPPWHQCDAPPANAGERAWVDADSVRLSAWLRREFWIDVSTSDCDRAVDVAARADPYHPVREYLEALPAWDQTPRLSTFARDYLGATHTDYTALVVRWWMISAVARALAPGCKADHVIILEGPQGRLKSQALRALAGDAWFLDTPLDLDSKDAYVSIAGRWIVELAELDALKGADTSRAKAFFSSPADTYRPPYGRRSVSVPRGCVFAGTTNDASYLRDSTGGRRYWPVACGPIDLEAIKRDRDVLWAEALHWYRVGARWWPDGAEVGLCEAEQEPRAEGDAWEPVVDGWLASASGLEPTIGDVLGGPLGLDRGQWDQRAQSRVARILQAHGYVRVRKRVGGRREWRYELPTTGATDAASSARGWPSGAKAGQR